MAQFRSVPKYQHTSSNYNVTCVVDPITKTYYLQADQIILNKSVEDSNQNIQDKLG